MTYYTKDALKEAIQQKLRLNYGCTEKQATDGEIMKACALALRDIMAVRSVDTQEQTQERQEKRVHYMSLEFLMGRSLMKNAYNLGILPQLTQAVEELGFSAPDIFDMEPDAGLGNGGLGRLAACYLDSMTTLDIPATGYSICYELGIFKQKIVDGQQVELPDDWLNLGDAWLMPKPQEAEEVHFGGKVRTRWDNGHLMVVHEDYTRVLAIPCDMLVAGYNTDHVNTLRLWDAKSPKPIDMQLFSQGQYLKANEERAMADSISTILYPEDNHYEGKSLRLKQQYFFVSATLQSITRRHIQTYGTLTNFHEKNVIQINDTHPALVIPELMRILIDDAGLGWDEAWDITATPWPIPTTPCWPRHWRAGPSGCSRRCCPASGRSCRRSRGAGSRRWTISITTPKRRRKWRLSGTAWSTWPTSASRGGWPLTACPLCTPTFSAATCSGTPAAWSRISSKTSPTAWTTGAGSARSTPDWTA